MRIAAATRIELMLSQVRNTFGLSAPNTTTTAISARTIESSGEAASRPVRLWTPPGTVSREVGASGEVTLMSLLDQVRERILDLLERCRVGLERLVDVLLGDDAERRLDPLGNRLALGCRH